MMVTRWATVISFFLKTLPPEIISFSLILQTKQMRVDGFLSIFLIYFVAVLVFDEHVFFAHYFILDN